MATWENNDNLFIKFGVTEGEVAEGGEVESAGPYKTLVFDIDLTDLPDIASSVLYLSDTTVLPAGAIVESVEVTVIEASAGTNSNFNLGLRKANSGSTNRDAYDDDGLLIAADGWHTSAQGTYTVYRQGDTDHGAVLGVASAFDSFIVAAYDTAAFTDGVIRVRINWYTPRVTS